MFLEKGVSGFEITGGYMKNDDASGIDVHMGYSLKGLLDIGASYSRITIDDDIIDDLSAIVISPSVTMHVLKQTNFVPVSIMLDAAYNKTMYYSDWLDDYNIDMKGTGYTYGVSVYNRISVTQSLDIVSSMGVGYNYADIETESTYGYSESKDDTDTLYTVSISLIADTLNHDKLIITPSFTADEDNTTFHLSVGYVAPLKQLHSGT